MNGISVWDSHAVTKCLDSVLATPDLRESARKHFSEMVCTCKFINSIYKNLKSLHETHYTVFRSIFDKLGENSNVCANGIMCVLDILSSSDYFNFDANFEYDQTRSISSVDALTILGSTCLADEKNILSNLMISLFKGEIIHVFPITRYLFSRDYYTKTILDRFNPTVFPTMKSIYDTFGFTRALTDSVLQQIYETGHYKLVSHAGTVSWGSHDVFYNFYIRNKRSGFVPYCQMLKPSASPN